jgi:hypothetical protein
MLLTFVADEGLNQEFWINPSLTERMFEMPI